MGDGEPRWESCGLGEGRSWTGFWRGSLFSPTTTATTTTTSQSVSHSLSNKRLHTHCTMHNAPTTWLLFAAFPGLPWPALPWPSEPSYLLHTYYTRTLAPIPTYSYPPDPPVLK